MTNRKPPLRMCIGCREMKDKSELIRIVKSKDGDISLDTTGKKNGRGAYICRSGECLKKAAGHNALAHAFSMNVDAGIYEKLKEELDGCDR